MSYIANFPFMFGMLSMYSIPSANELAEQQWTRLMGIIDLAKSRESFIQHLFPNIEAVDEDTK